MLLSRLGFFSVLLLCCGVGGVAAQLPQKPVLQLEAGGPVAPVSALAFSPDGHTLYAAGLDKVVRAWERDPQGRFVLKTTYRVPIGPGADGAINALAISPDGRWLAVAGFGVMREAAGFQEVGFLQPRGRLSLDMLQDMGTIHLFDTTNKGKLHLLRKHRGPVQALRFAPEMAGRSPVLASVAREPGRTGVVGTLRLWDVDTRQELASQDWHSPPPTRPGLAIWNTGPANLDVTVALAVQGQGLRLWNAKTGLAEVDKARKLNDTVAFHTGMLLFGHLDKGGDLQGWKVERANPQPAAAVSIRGGMVVRDLEFLNANHAALVVQTNEGSPDPQNRPYRLLVCDVRPTHFGSVKAEVFLWRSPSRPVLAASPDGKLLAVAGNASHHIHLYSRNALLAKEADPVQRLQGTGVIVPRVEFVRKAEQAAVAGLYLAAPAANPAETAKVILDFQARRLVPTTGWKFARPENQSDWDLQVPQPRRAGATYKVGLVGKASQTIRLEYDQVPTAEALLPPCQPLNRPLLAVALNEGNTASIALYDAESGSEIRRFFGHAAPIHHLGFASDGRLLASAAQDKSVCVWSLTDLDRTIGQRGMLRGLAIKPGLVVGGLELVRANAENQQRLRAAGVAEEDALDGVVTEDGLQKFDTPTAFYEALWSRRAGSPITLQFARRGLVKLRVDQGVDTPKPLFSVFVPALQTDGPWLGWSPAGPYDTRDRARDDGYLGWLRNPERFGEPVEYSTVARQKEFRREGILRHLVEKGNLAAALNAWKNDPVVPEMGLRIDKLDPLTAPRDAKGQLVLQGPGPFSLQATILGVEPARIERVRWRLDDEQVQPFDHDQGDRLSVPLTTTQWPRGPHKLHMLLTTSDGLEHQQSLAVHSLPQAPTVQFDPDWLLGVPKDRVVKEEKFHPEVRVRPGTAGQPVQIGFQLNDSPPVWRDAQAGAEKWSVDLRPGDNVLTVRATNTGASKELGHLESASVRLVIRHVPKKVPPPQVTLTSLRIGAAETILLPAAQPLVVAVPNVRIQGRIRAESPITEALREKQPLSNFDKAKKAQTLEFDEAISLQPGDQTITFSAKSGQTAAVPATLKLAYHPELPRLSPLEPRKRERRADQSLTYRLDLRLTESAFPYTARLIVNESKKPSPTQVVDWLLQGEVQLRPGLNRLRILLTNPYRTHAEDLEIYAQQPPVIVKVAANADAKRPVADLEAVVLSPGDLPPVGARVNGQDVPGVAFEAIQRDKSWLVRVRDVALVAGKNAFALSVRNRDGISLTPGTATLVYQPPARPPTPAVVEWIQPPDTVKEPRCELRFSVRSSSPYRVVVRHGTRELQPQADPQKRDLFRLKVEGLTPNANVLELVVDNAAGPVRSALVVTYAEPWTVRFHADRLERLDKPGVFIPPNEPVPTGRVRLHGAFEWREQEKALSLPARLKVYVNDFRQGDADLSKPDKLRRTFTVDLWLNQDENLVELKPPPALKIETWPKVRIRCLAPAREQQLHLLLLAPGERDQKKLTDSVLSAFQAKDIQGNRFGTAGAFTAGWVYPLAPVLTPQGLPTALWNVDKLLRERRGAMSDVLVLYFAGEDVIQGEKRYLHTRLSKKTGELADAIDCDKLRSLLGDLHGAKVLLLDLQANGRQARQEREDHPHQGLCCFVWLGKMDAPEKARLRHALQDTLARKSLVRDQVELLRGWAKGLGQDAVLQQAYPAGLQGLRLSEANRK